MLARYVRSRDLTCRFPGCTAPAEFCDIDHVIPYPLGATHPSNLACLCRNHHHLKTFWTGDWELRLLPDGAAVWTSPTGQTYTTASGMSKLLPRLGTPTPENSPPPSNTGGLQHRPRREDAPPQTNPRQRPPRTHQNRTRTQQSSQENANAKPDRRQLPTAAVLRSARRRCAARASVDVVRRARERQPHERAAAHRVEVDAGRDRNAGVSQQFRAERQRVRGQV